MQRMTKCISITIVLVTAGRFSSFANVNKKKKKHKKNTKKPQKNC